MSQKGWKQSSLAILEFYETKSISQKNIRIPNQQSMKNKTKKKCLKNVFNKKKLIYATIGYTLFVKK